jgi:hypothetical protein
MLLAAGVCGSPPQVTDIRLDLAMFDHRFGLPAARLPRCAWD